MDFQAWGSLLSGGMLEWIGIGVFFALALLDSMRSGSGRACAVALALPITLFFSQAAASAVILGPFVQAGNAPAFAPILIFGILFAVLYLAIRRILFDYTTGTPLQALAAAVGTTIIALVVWLQVPAFDTLWHLGPRVQMVFAEAYRFWLILVAFGALAYARS